MATLKLDQGTVDEARYLAKDIAGETQEFIDKHSTVSTERAVCRLLGIDGIDQWEVPLPNIVVDQVKNKGHLSLGIAYYIGNVMLHTGLDPNEIGQQVGQGQLDVTSFSPFPLEEIKGVLEEVVTTNINKIKKRRQKREEFLKEHGDKQGPLLYVIVATGNIYEDRTQAIAAARQGADVIAVIRTTGQSLLDYVPYGITTEGFGGTYATQANFKIIREALDEVGEELGRYIRLCNYCSGLCMPEIAVMGAFEGLDVMLNDALYGILFRDINMERTLIDQYFSRVINSFAGVIINTGEDNYLTTSDAYEEAHTVLASQFINEQFALLAGLKEEQMGLGHAFEMDPTLENGFLYELAQAQMARQIFPKAPLKYMPPTKFMTGNIFRGHVQDALFNMITVMTNQRIHLLGMLTEALHTPFMSDRALAIENARYIGCTMKDLGDEITFKEDGIIEKRAKDVLQSAKDLLSTLKEKGIFQALEEGIFADVKRPQKGGKGLEGVFLKDAHYFNPFIEPMMKGCDRG